MFTANGLEEVFPPGSQSPSGESDNVRSGFLFELSAHNVVNFNNTVQLKAQEPPMSILLLTKHGITLQPGEVLHRGMV
jgi:hypothetical protein